VSLKRIEKVKKIVTQAGEIALRYYGKTTGTRKEDRTIVTEADIEVGKFLNRRLLEEFPDYGLINEEDEKPATEKVLKKKEYIWVIDPIDGSSSFNSRLPIWGIAVGLLKCAAEGELSCDSAVMGMIYLPVTEEFYYTDEGSPAIFESRKWGKTEMNISDRDDKFDEESFVCVTSNIIKDIHNEFPGKARSLGSTSAHFCYVSRGDAVGALVKGHLWDLVMGFAILKKAGGEARYLTGKDLDLSKLISPDIKSGYMIISSPKNLPKLLKIIKKEKIPKDKDFPYTF